MKNASDLYLKYLDPSSKLDFIRERLEDIQEILEEVNYEICRDGVKANC